MRHRIVTYEAGYVVEKPYGCLGFMGDIIMIALTGGLWLIWIFVREMRGR